MHTVVLHSALILIYERKKSVESEKILPENGRIHFIGVGGISMSALAQILLKSGYCVSGSDINYGKEIQKLEALGLKFYLGHDGENVKNAAAVVYTMAVHDDNPEMAEARKCGIPILRRSQLLGAIMEKYKHSVAIAGTHGKTTVTSMLSYIFEKNDTDPTILVGAELDIINGNVKTGGGDCFIAEACEYHRSFLDFNPYCAVILNVEPDHLDYYKDAEDYHSAYRDFLKRVQKDGFVLLCADEDELVKMKGNAPCNVYTYGIENKNADFKVENATVGKSGIEYDLYYNEEKICHVSLPIFGKHNISNSAAAIGCAYLLGIAPEKAAYALRDFKGAGRRFEYKGDVNGAYVYDDYAHHPTEIAATLDAVSEIPHGRTICVFQPHTYSRTKTFFDDFAKILSSVDIPVLADIYAARETDDGSVNSDMLRHEITQKYGKTAYYFDSFDKITKFVTDNAQGGDIVIVMGAGNIVNITKEIIKK